MKGRKTRKWMEGKKNEEGRTENKRLTEMKESKCRIGGKKEKEAQVTGWIFSQSKK